MKESVQAELEDEFGDEFDVAAGADEFGGMVRCGVVCGVESPERKQREIGSESSRRVKGRVLFFMND